MRLRKIVTGVLIASSLGMSVPVLAAPAPDAGMLEGDGGGFAGGSSSVLFAELLAVVAAALATAALINSSKSP